MAKINFKVLLLFFKISLQKSLNFYKKKTKLFLDIDKTNIRVLHLKRKKY